jgi:hypothetical protein
MDSIQPLCLLCDQTSDQVPLIKMQYRGRDYWICPQHLPKLIHNPAELEGILPGAKDLQPSQHEH